MKKIKVLFLGTYPHSDNPLKGVFNHRAVLRLKEEVNIDVISIRMWKPGRKLVDIIIEGNTTVYHLNIPHYSSTNLLIHQLSSFSIFFFIWVTFRKKIKQYDAIHSVGASNYGIYGCFLSRRFKIKHVMQLIGSDINSDLPKLYKLHYVQKIPMSIDFIVGNSGDLVKRFNKLFKTQFPVQKIYRGVNLKRYQFVENNFNANKGAQFLYLGGLNDYPNLPAKMNTKGGITLMNSWSLIEKELKKARATLVFGGPQSDRREFYTWYNSLNFPELVKLIGELNQIEVHDAYKNNNVVIIPSMEEGLPNVATESAAYGRPIIASRVGGIPEIVDENNSGILCSAGNEEELSKAILMLANDQKYVQELGRNARLKVEEYFDEKNFSTSYFKIYNQMLN